MEKILKEAVAILEQAGCEPARMDAELLLAYVISGSRIDLYLKNSSILSLDQLSRFNEFIVRRARHEPMAYILGYCEFYGYPFQVNPAVLIPRSETELLVDHALKALASNDDRRQDTVRLLDIGTGSGCLAITLAKKIHGEVVAWDNSSAALDVARTNSAALHAEVTFELRDLLDEESWKVVHPFDLIVSNPPYIRMWEKSSLPASVIHYEPAGALFGGEDGLDFYRGISKNSRRILREGGQLILEIGYQQGAEVVSLLAGDGYKGISLFQDLGGCDRVVVAKLGG